MPIAISGTTGISGVDGSNTTPAVRGSDTNTGMVFPAADTIAFVEGGTEVMRIDSSGNVGVGTSSPGAKLGVVGSTNSTILSVSGSNSSLIWQEFTTSGIATNYFWNANGTFNFGTNTSNPLILATNGTERGRFDTSGNFLFNSGYGSVTTAYGCRAWVNFNGTGTVAIRSSGNITSITDNGVGDYTVNFTNAMPDANYSSVASCAKNDTNNDGNQTAVAGGFSGSLQTSSACRIRTVYITGFAAQDSPQVTFAVFR